MKRQTEDGGVRRMKWHGSVAIRTLGLAMMIVAVAVVIARTPAGSSGTSIQIAPHLTAKQRMMRQKYYDLRRDLPHGIPPMARTRALEQLQASEGTDALIPLSSTHWSFIGPQPIT